MIFWLSISLSILCILKTKNTKKINPWDILFLLSSWQIFNLGVWQDYLIFTIAPYKVSAVILIFIILWYIEKRGIKLGLNFSKTDLFFILKSLVILIVLLAPVGLYVNFLKFNPILDIKILFSTAISYILFVGVVEELVFRGILYNLLEKTLEPWSALIISNIFFATIYSHISGGGVFPNWTYVAFAFIAGVVYSVSYIKTRSIFVPILIHGLTDTIWKVFLT